MCLPENFEVSRFPEKSPNSRNNFEYLMAFKFYQTPPNTIKHDQTRSNSTKQGHQTFDQKCKTFLLFACLMHDVLFVWTPAYQTCLMRACVPRMLSGLYQLFHLCLIKTCFNRLATHFNISMLKQCLIVFGRQTFILCPGPYLLKNTEIQRNKENIMKTDIASKCIAFVSDKYLQTHAM